MCEQFPELRTKVDQLYRDRHEHPVPDEGLIETLATCPDCAKKAKEVFLPGLAKRFGFRLHSDEKDSKPETDVKSEVKPEEVKESPAPAPEEHKENPKKSGQVNVVDFLTGKE